MAFSEFEYPSVQNQAIAGTLRVVDLENCPFKVRRVFTVCLDRPQRRGGHAHRFCNQLVICIMGSIDLVVDDGVNKQLRTLSATDKGIWIPAGFWAEQHYSGPSSAILVLCDRPYEEDDYIRDYGQFLKFVDSKK